MGHVEAVLSEGAMVSRRKLQKAVTARKAGSSRRETADMRRNLQKSKFSLGKITAWRQGAVRLARQSHHIHDWDRQTRGIPPVSKAVQCLSCSSMQGCHSYSRE